ncbi:MULTISPECIES: excisionase [unclassified Bradyrhizobium]|uniref:excisionase n=1 Tax=unclassified Bradyrhizobium TaxID=2631580 RepID=UPI002916FB98|nr:MULTISPECIES: excisionase [unclassified Bradyrhizobium]
MIDTPKHREAIGPHDPLRLSVAAAMAFPDGSMTASGLRRESARGRLIIERIAGKDYTTLFHIERMRELCRVQAKEPGSTNAKHGIAEAISSLSPFGLSRMATGMSPQDALRARLKRSRRRKQSKR